MPPFMSPRNGRRHRRWAPMSDAGLHLYILERSDVTGLLKIGRSGCPAERAMELERSQAFHVNVAHVFPNLGLCEQALHDEFAHRRANAGAGREWFQTSVLEVVACVERLKANAALGRSGAVRSRRGNVARRADTVDDVASECPSRPSITEARRAADGPPREDVVKLRKRCRVAENPPRKALLRRDFAPRSRTSTKPCGQTAPSTRCSGSPERREAAPLAFPDAASSVPSADVSKGMSEAAAEDTPARPALDAQRPRGKTAARFYAAVAAACDEKMTARMARTFLLAVKEVVHAELARGVKTIAVPHICRFKTRTLAARSSLTKVVFGKQVEIKARRGGLPVLKSTPAKTLKDSVQAGART